MNTAESGQKRALRIQRKIFKSLQKEVEFLLGRTPASIKKYERENQQDFRNSYQSLQAIQKSDLIETIRTADVTLIADFHTFEQAQKTALRLAREAVQENELWYLGLELVPSHLQDFLDQFQKDKISTEEFHQAIAYSDEWGFPWSNYAPLFEWAKKTGVKMIALNRPRLFESQTYLGDDLHQRDLWAAGIITDLFYADDLQNRKPRMVVLYGELHVGNSHLPKRIKQISKAFLRRALSTVVIHQNENRLYWKLAEEGSEISTAITKLKKNTYCVFSSTPWTKLQSLVNWAEGGHAEHIHEEMDDLGLISNYGKIISEFFKIPNCSYETLSTHRIDQPRFLDQLECKSEWTTEEQSLIRSLVNQNQRFYLQNPGLGFLGTSSSNGLAEIAAIHLYRSREHSSPSLAQFFKRTPEYFYHHLIDGIFGFFGSLILNPKRKCDLVVDHLQRIEALQLGATPDYRQEILARSLTLDFLQSQRSVTERFKQQPKIPLLALYWATRYSGQIYGKSLYSAALSGKISVDWLTSTFELQNNGDTNSISRSSILTFQTLIQQLTTLDWSASKNDQL